MSKKAKKRGYYIPIRSGYYLVHKDGEYFELNLREKVIYNPENNRRKKNIKRHWLQKIRKKESDKTIELIRIDGQLDSIIYDIRKKDSENLIRETRHQERPKPSISSHKKLKRKKGSQITDKQRKLEEAAGKEYK